MPLLASPADAPPMTDIPLLPSHLVVGSMTNRCRRGDVEPRFFLFFGAAGRADGDFCTKGRQLPVPHAKVVTARPPLALSSTTLGAVLHQSRCLICLGAHLVQSSTRVLALGILSRRHTLPLRWHWPPGLQTESGRPAEAGQDKMTAERRAKMKGHRRESKEGTGGTQENRWDDIREGRGTERGIERRAKERTGEERWQ